MPTLASSLSKCAATSTPLSSEDFLASFPKSQALAYTTSRSLPGSLRVFELERQLARLVSSSKSLFQVDSDAALRTSILQTMRDALLCEDAHKSACKLTTVCCPGNYVTTHCGPLLRRADARCVVAFGGPPRANAAAKDVRWVEERKCFVDPALEETLLLDPAGQVLEGSQTNFFAVERGPVLVTAKDGVLLGTVRASVLEACAALGIAVRLQAPGVGDVHEWQECFISSTSRLVMGVDEIRPCPEWGSAQTHVLPAERPVTSRIQQWVQAHLWERSEDVGRALGDG